MRKRTTIGITVGVLVLALLLSLLAIDMLPQNEERKLPQDVYIGVDVGFGNETDIYKVVNAIDGYANLIIIGSLAVTTDTPTLTRVCNFLYNRGFSFIIYVGFGKEVYYPPQGPDQKFFNTTVKQWGNKFLGAYFFDEIGGKQLDYAPGTQFYSDKPVQNATDFTDAAAQFVHALNGALTNYTGPKFYDAPNLKVFTSDYGLYWFDYQFGYNVVLGQFVGNQSRQLRQLRQLTVALCRGAANSQHLDWGTMITWTYDSAPFLENGSQLYNDMVLAYENDAKYIVIFNSPDNQTKTTELGTLTPDHLNAMKQFWNYANTHSRPQGDPAQTAYVLPKDYGFGFRKADDNIWGLWPADNLSAKVWNDANSLLSTYGTKLDIVYETQSDNLQVRLMYNQLIFWNGTIIGQP